MSIRIRFILLIALSLCISISAVGIVVIRRERAAALGALERQGYALADALSVTFLAHHLRGEDDLIREIGTEVVAGDVVDSAEAPLYLVVLSADGRTLFSRGNEALAPDHDETLSHNAIVTSSLHVTDRVELTSGVRALDLKSRMFFEDAGGGLRRFGAVRLGLSLEPFEQQALATYRTVLVLGLLALLLGIGATYLTTLRLMDSLLYLGRRVRAIAGGDLRQSVQMRGKGVLTELEQSVNRLAEDLEKRDLLKQYISRSTWDEIEKTVSGEPSSDVHDGGLRRVTILFMDIRNFTALAESAPSQEVVELLNEVFGMMVDIIETYGGVLDKFIGDALLTVFYPDDVDDDAIRSVYCAVEMQLRLEQFNQRRAFYGRNAVSAGIGINSGQVIAGTIGAKTRKDYTVIGDPVNVAARLEKRSKEGRHTRIVISDETYAGIRGLVKVEPLAGTLLKGRQKPVPVYEIVSVKDVDQILNMLTSSDATTREHGFKAVEARGDGEAVPVLVNILEAADEELILRAIVVLGRLGRDDERIAPVLESIIRETSNKRFLATAIKATAFLCSGVDVALLRSALSDGDARVRANTIEALDLLGGAAYVEWIEPLMHDTNSRVRANAAVALWKRGRFEVGSVLERLSYSPKASERACAVFAAGELFRVGTQELPEKEGARRASLDPQEVFSEELGHYRKLVTIIERLLADETPSVRQQAVKAAGRARQPTTLEGLLANLRGCSSEEKEAIFEAIRSIGLPRPMVHTMEKMVEEHGNA